MLKFAPVAQLDRVLGYEPRGQEFESLRARQIKKGSTFVDPFYFHSHISTVESFRSSITHQDKVLIMLLVLLGLILALLPIILTSAFPHLVVVSIYAGLIPWLAFGWAVLIITILLRRKRIAEWRQNRKLKKQMKKGRKLY